jgi:hypothetical protein
VRHTMRPFKSTILLFLLPSQFLLGQTKNEIINLKIYSVDHISTWQKKPRIYKVFYDEKGNIIKEVETLQKTNTKTITRYKYSDTLLIQSIEQGFENGKLINSLLTSYTYQFDKEKRLKSKKITNSSKNILIEKYSYNSNNKLDTVFVYNNDTTIWTPQQHFTGERKLNKTASIKKIKVYSYLDSNGISIQECNYPSFESYSCKTYETIESDTLDISIERFWGRQGCIMDSAQSIQFTKLHKKNGSIYFKESNIFFDTKIYYEYQKNNLGLVTQTTATSLADDKKLIYVTNHKYYFRQ